MITLPRDQGSTRGAPAPPAGALSFAQVTHGLHPIMVMSYHRSMPANPNGVVTPVKPRARSYSQLSRYTDCAKSFELTYERRVPRRPGVWFPAGSAFHRTIERYLLEVAVPKEAQA